MLPVSVYQLRGISSHSSLQSSFNSRLMVDLFASTAFQKRWVTPKPYISSASSILWENNLSCCVFHFSSVSCPIWHFSFRLWLRLTRPAVSEPSGLFARPWTNRRWAVMLFSESGSYVTELEVLFDFLLMGESWSLILATAKKAICSVINLIADPAKQF